MEKGEVSVDEFLNARKGYVKNGDCLVKAGPGSPPKGWDNKTRRVQFIMSTQQEDHDKDIIIQAGLQLDLFLQNPVAPLQHRSSNFPVGHWEDVQQQLNGRPPRTEGVLQLVAEGVDEDADRLARHIGAGTIRASSIGFLPKTVKRRPPPEGQDPNGYYWNGYEILEATLLECSPVLIPANPGALAKAAADGDVIARGIIEEVLDRYAYDPATRQLISREEWEKHYVVATNDRKSFFVPKRKELTTQASDGHPSADGLPPQTADDGSSEEKTIGRTVMSFLGKLFGTENEEKLKQVLQERLAEEETPVADPAAAPILSERQQKLRERLAAKRILDDQAA